MVCACASNAAAPTGGGDDAGACTQVGACPIDLPAATMGPSQRLADVCFRDPPPQSSGLYDVCLVGPDGRLYLTVLSGSADLEAEGWTHSGYGGVQAETTLSHDDQVRCSDALTLALTQPDAAPGLYCR